MKRNDITAFILAGGVSRRMRENKCLLTLNGKKVIEIIFDKLSGLFENVCISTSSAVEYDFLPAPQIQDLHKRYGPLGGIYACLDHSQTERNFFISCDLPLVSAEVIDHICNYKSEKKIVVPVVGDYKQYLCGIYNKKCTELIDGQFALARKRELDKNPNFSMKMLLSKCDYDLIPIEKTEHFETGMFLNMNTPAEYALIKQLYNNFS